MEAPQLSEEELNQIYNWIDEIPLSRPKKNISRDFADGVLMAEIVHHFAPKLVELHNYVPSHSVQAKLTNWNTLNKYVEKVFKKMGFQVTSKDIDSVINAAPDAIERVMKVVQVKIDKYMQLGEYDPNPSVQPRVYNYYNQPQHNQQYDMPQNQQGRKGPNYEHHGGHGGADDRTLQEFRETIEILELKIKKLEQLVKLKDSKISTLQNKLAQAGIM